MQEALSVLQISDLLGSPTGRAAVSELLDTATGLLSPLTADAAEAARLLSSLHGQGDDATVLTQLLLKVTTYPMPACAGLQKGSSPVSSNVNSPEPAVPRRLVTNIRAPCSTAVSIQ